VDRKFGGENVFESRLEHRGVDFGATLDIDELAPFLKGNRPEHVTAIVHLGACTDTLELDEAVHERQNVAYSEMLWRWASKHQVPLVYASSAATYGDGSSGYNDDESRLANLRPLNAYGRSKHKFDLWALDRERTGEVPSTWAGFKFFNVYGFGERHKGRMASVILQSIDQIQKSGKVRLFRSHKEGIADGEQKRDFVLVEDVVDVLMYAASGGVKRGIYNLGSGKARTFSDLAGASFRALATAPSIEFIDMPVDLRQRYQYFTEALMERLRRAGYTKSFTSLEEGIQRYVTQILEGAP
jgi:ADP-L-glycero-D-manno-heptose 6-epimerase